MNESNIYLDYAASTPIDRRSYEAMQPFLLKRWGNAAGLHSFGKTMREALDKARHRLAIRIGARDSEIIFCASATEANNTILKGLVQRRDRNVGHIIISAIEHASVYEVALALMKQGVEVSILPVNASGLVSVTELRKHVRSDTFLVSVMHVNNELGTIQPIADIAEFCRQNEIMFHTDAAQSFGKLPINVHETGIDFLTASSHKIYGPPGAALIFCKRDLPFEPLLHGGGHEEGRRSSTPNVAAAVGFAAAADIYMEEHEAERRRLAELRRLLRDYIIQRIPEARVNAADNHQLPHILNVSFKDADSELLQMQLDRDGVAISTGSACTSGVVGTSRILDACGIEKRWAKGTIRISFGRFTTRNELDRLMALLPETVDKIRKIS